MTTPYATPVLDDRWIVAVVDRIDALPSTLADVADAETVGRDDAELGLPCQPLAHYIRLGDIEAYIVGWKDATATLHAELGETEDYEEDMLDREYHARGMW